MNQTDKISYALIELGYNSGWVISGEEITWIDEPEVRPTQEQIDNKILEIENILETRAQQERSLKISAYQKLGLTEDEINAILGGIE
jgi:hypothetical protein